MKRLSPSAPGLAVFAMLITVLFFQACRRNNRLVDINPEFAKYIESYTSGTISKTGTISIKLLPGIAKEHALNEVVRDPLFHFSPSVDGEAHWVDERTVEFRPSEKLKPGELYEVKFMLGKVAEVPDELEEFVFNVKILEPSFTLQEEGLKTDGNSKVDMVFTGQITTADHEDSALVEKIVTVTGGNSPLEVTWSHDAEAIRHRFTVTGIKREETAGELRLAWDGAPINAPVKGETSMEIPAIGDFKVLKITAMNEEESHVLIQFSAPINAASDLRGLITLEPEAELSYTVVGSEVSVFFDEEQEGEFKVNVYPGIEDIWGEKLQKGKAAFVLFESRKPMVKILGTGEIIPGSGKIMLPFEAGNLTAVDVSIVRVYENNIPQFFQINGWDEGEYLRRVGKPVVQRTIRLDSDKSVNLKRRQRFSLDLDQLLKAEPGALYRITIGFRPEYSLYTCTDTSTVEEENNYNDYYYDDYEYSGGSWSDDDDKFWETYDDYYPFGYDWDQRDNPCSPSYYNKERWETRNIMASNLGLTVKRGNDKSMTVLVTDLVTTEPASGVQLELLDYQQQIIHKASTDGNGFATFSLKAQPFLLVAKRGNERGYLKLDDGNSLLISRFDVSGDEVKNGIKGFIYGERGVWRPGDSLYINFMLEDKDNLIPAEHPVEFTLTTPTGQLYRKLVAHESVDGLYTFRTTTDPSAPTGNWNAQVKVGGSVFEKRIKVETIMPNRLKIFLDFGGKPVLESGTSQPVTLTSRWLFGAPAQNLKARVDVSLFNYSTAFENYKTYVFDDPSRSFDAVTKTVFDDRLGPEGSVTFTPDAGEAEGAPGMLKANFLVKVFEPGGAFSIDQISVPYSPYPSYVGIKVPKGQEPWDFLLTGKSYDINIVNVSPQGKPMTGSSEVTAEFYKLEWRWWWDNSGDDGGNYASSQYSKLIKRETVTLSGNGTGKWRISVPTDDWGRYLVTVVHPDGHRTGKVVYFDDPYWQSRNRMGDASSATMLSFSADKTSYNVGETATLNIPSSAGGKLFISLENGRKVLQTHLVETQSGQTTFQFKVTPEMAPNIYVYASLIQPHSQTTNDRPMRMYGLVPVEVKDPQTILKPRITMADVVRPEQPFSISVSEDNGKEMTYSLAIVDEGLLDLTRFRTPDPHAYFYAKEALGVKTWDIFDHVIGSQGGNMGRILTIGGDEGLAVGKQKGANRFEPVVRYMGPFRLKNGERKVHSVTLPPYFGSVRVMVVAGRDARYGSAEKTVAVRSPLMINTTLPRVLGPSEEIQIPVTVFATEKSVKQATVELETSPSIEILGNRSKTVNFTGLGEQTVYFDARIKPATGRAEVRVKATSGANKAQSRTSIDILNPNPYITRWEAQNLSYGQSWSGKAEPIGVPATSKATLEVSSSPPINLEKRVDYLIQYPHGCVEQTTSAVFGQLVLAELTDVSPARKKEIDKNIRAAISKLKNFQLHDGGFGYWQGARQADEWGTNYAGHFLLEAKAKGYAVPDEMLASWLKYQKNKAARWSMPTESYMIYSSELTQSYRLYLLALARVPEIGAMNRFKESANVSAESKWRLAAAYQMAGYTRVAEGMVRNLPTNFETQNDYGYTFGSDLRNKAMVLETCALLGFRRQGATLAEQIAAQLSSDEWLSTQTTAYSLLAISKFNGASPGQNKINATVTLNGQTLSLTGSSYIKQVPVYTGKGPVSFKLVNNGSGLLYARLIREGQPLPDEAIAEVKSSSNLGLSVDFIDFSGKPVDTKNLKQGKDFLARVKVVNPGGRGKYTNLALSLVFPSGWEIINTRLWDSESSFASSPSTYQNVRDDRVYIYLDLKEKETRTYYVMLNAAYAGKYYLPMMSAAAMYDNKISASVPGQWVLINP